MALAAGYIFLSVAYTKTLKSSKTISESDRKVVVTSSKNRCPNCGDKDLTKYLDGSGYCESCGKTFKSAEKFRREEKQGSD